MIHIALCHDDNYAPYSASVLSSIMENNKGMEFTFHILHTNITGDKQNVLAEWIHSKGCEIHFYQMNVCLFMDFPLGNKIYLNYGAYFRLYLAECLHSLNKVIYLDCDLVVTGCLENLWNTEMNEWDVAGVRDRINDYIRVYNRLGYPMTDGYINSGVLLINLKRWREKRFFKKALDTARLFSDVLKNHDQDLINMICHGNIKFLDFKYNLLEYYLYTEDWLYLDRKYYPEIIDACRKPVIIHFCMPVKPWHKECINPFRELYYKYRVMTPWPEIKLIHKKNELTKKHKIKNLLSTLGLYHIESRTTLRNDINVLEEKDNILF